MENNSNNSIKESTLLTLLAFRFVPYWPLFGLILISCLILAGAYLLRTTPVYEISATVLIKDETKGANDSKVADFLNIYRSKKIVENEIEVIRSKKILRDVVDKLHLYAPVQEQSRFKSFSAYISSPIEIEVKEPFQLKEYGKIPFNVQDTKTITLSGKSYLFNQWVKTPYGILRFTKNTHQSLETENALYFSLVHPKRVVAGILKNLEVNSLSKLSTVISLKYKDEVPLRGELVLDELIDSYGHLAVNDKNVLSGSAISLIEDRMKSVKVGLDSVERAMQQYKSRQGAIDLSTQSKLFLESVSENESKVADISKQLAVLDMVENYVVSKHGGKGIVPATLGMEDPVLSQLLQRLSGAELQYESLKQTIPENNSVLISLAKEIDQIRPGILENIRNQQASLKASKNTVNASGNSFYSGLQTLPLKERKLLEISRQYSVQNDVYAFLLQKREEMKLSYGAAEGVSQVVDKAESSLKPVSPKPWLIILGAFACTAVLANLIIMLKEHLGSKILFRSDISALTKVPVAAEMVFLKHFGKQVALEQFLQLQSVLGLNSNHLEKKKILVTSTVSGEGKTFVSHNLALSLAYSGKKVVLIDMNIRNSKTLPIPDSKERKGMAEYLAGEVTASEIVYHDEKGNLSLITPGRINNNSTVLFPKNKIDELFSYVDNEFDYIIVDASPVEQFSNTSIISQYCEKTLFIIRHGFTPKTLVQYMDVNSKLKVFPDMAIVFNGVRKRGFIRSDYGFGYGYGYDYSLKST